MTSCINHPHDSHYIKVYDWQVVLCEGNTTTAALLSFFERWHNVKLAMRPKNIQSNNVAAAHGDERSQDESTLQFHSEQELIDGIQSIGKRDSVRKSINWLESKGFISIHSNPNKRYAFDKTRYFQFYPDVLNEWLKTGMSVNRPPMSKNQSRSSEKQLPSLKKQSPSSEITSAITDYASEETSDYAPEEIPPIVPHAIAVVVEEERGDVPSTLQITVRPETRIIRNPNGSEQFPWESPDPIETWAIEEGFLKYVWPFVKDYTNFKNLRDKSLRATRRALIKYVNRAHYEPERREEMLGHWNDYQDELHGVSDGYSDLTQSDITRAQDLQNILDAIE